MKKSRFSDNQIVNILKQAEQGGLITELWRDHNIGQSTFYNWRSKYGGMDASLISRLTELLLGIHRAGMYNTATGQIAMIEPNANIPISITQVPNNIGVAINSKEILGLEKEVERRLTVKF